MAVAYTDERTGERRHRIFIGSANASQNAGHGTYEHFYEIDMAHPVLFNQVKAHARALREHRRTAGFAETYMRIFLYSVLENPHKVLQTIDASDDRFPTEWDLASVEAFQEIYMTYEIDKVITELSRLGSQLEESPLSGIGRRMIAMLMDLKTVTETFKDDHFYLMWFVATKAPDEETTKQLKKYLYAQLGIDCSGLLNPESYTGGAQ